MPTNPHGRFYTGHVVQHPGDKRRRVLCFVTPSGVVGCSRSFKPRLAMGFALRAERREDPFPAEDNWSAFFTKLLQLRGFPVHTPEDAIDDITAAYIGKEFFTPYATPPQTQIVS